MEKSFTEQRLIQRNNEHQSTFGSEKAKQSFENFAIELRKKNRYKYFQSKRTRKIQDTSSDDPENEILALLNSLETMNQKFSFLSSKILTMDISIKEKKNCFNLFAKQIKNSESANFFIHYGLLDIITINFYNDNNGFLDEMTLLITNSGTADEKNCLIMKNKGILDFLIQNVENHSEKIIENSLWGISNMLIGCKDIREYLIKLNFHPKIIKMIDPNSCFSYLIYRILGELSTNISNKDEIFFIFVDQILKNYSIKNLRACL